MFDEKQTETTKTERETKTEPIQPAPGSTKQTETTKTERETKKE
jgi:hypothetical protein